jgi:hypothetical protein
MRKALAPTAAALLVLIPTLARGQVPPAPAQPEPKVHLGAGVLLGFPHGDLNRANDDGEGDAEASPGLRFSMGYRATPNLTLAAFFRYTFIQLDEPEFSEESVSARNYDLGALVRLSHALSPTFTLFGDLELYLSTLSVTVEFPGLGEFSNSEDGLGFGVRAGGAIAVAPKVWLAGSLAWNNFSIEFEDPDGNPAEDIDSGWTQLTGELWFAF